MAISNHERVGKAMDLLKGGLGPFVEREIKSTCKDPALRNTPGRILPGSRRRSEAGRCGRTGTGLTQDGERRDVSFLAADTWRPGQRSAWAKNYRGGFECRRREGGQESSLVSFPQQASRSGQHSSNRTTVFSGAIGPVTVTNRRALSDYP